MDSVFSLRNVRCGYRPGIPVIQIKSLEVPTGKVIFVLGLSGIGKSTLLESLGLMSRTIFNSDRMEFQFKSSHSASTLNMSDVWDGPETVRSEIRRKYFSFIFQQTYLLHGFTAGENMMLGLLSEGSSLGSAMDQVINLMAGVGLHRDIFDRSIVELSGGQKQRLSFIKSFASSFEVLFADEPTGNVDRETAHMLMQLLCNRIHEDRKTAIIVSHDVELASQYGDVIMIMTPVLHESTVTGTIDAQNIYHKHDEAWYDPDLKLCPEMATVVKEIYRRKNL